MSTSSKGKKMPPEALVHPKDRAALLALAKTPGMEWLIATFAKYSYEKMRRIALLESGVLVGSKAYPELFAMMEKISDALDIPRPDLFVRLDPAWYLETAGVTRPMILITTGYLEALSDAEVLCLLAREACHIQCLHLPYLTIRQFAADFAHALGPFGAILAAPRLALEEWWHAAQYTCDRGALFVSRQPEIMFQLLQRLGGGGATHFGGVAKEAYQDQAKILESMVQGAPLDKAYRMLLAFHPEDSFWIRRTQELALWAESEEYRTLLRGEKVSEDSTYRAATEPPRWGEYCREGMGEGTWRAPEMPMPPCPAAALMEGFRTAIGSASEILQEGASAMGRAFHAFFEALQSPSSEKRSSEGRSPTSASVSGNERSS